MRRAICLVAVGCLLAVGLVIVPKPAVVWASELETRTTPVALVAVGDAEVRAAEAAVEDATVAAHDHAGSESHDHEGEILGARDEGLEPFTAIGVTTANRPDAPVRVRVAHGGSWQPWRELVHVEDHSPDGAEDAAERPGATTEPLFVGRADAYELQVPAPAGEVSVHLVTEVDRRRQVVDATEAAEGAPTIRSRSAWGARAAEAPPADAGELKLAVIHHSVTSNSYSRSQVPELLRSIQTYHMDAHGWNDIAYNFAVDRYGTIWEARAGGIDRAIIGGHAYGFNTASTGVMVLGDHRSSSPTSASLDAVEDLLAWKLAEHHTPTTGGVTYQSSADTEFGPEGTPVRVDRISGHRDVRNTGCPGDALYARLGSVRDGVADKTPSARTDASAALVEGDRTGDGRGDLLLYRPGGSSDISLTGTGGDSGALDIGDSESPGFRVASTNVYFLYQPFSGDFDGDGNSDIFWYAPGPSTDHIWYGRAGGGHDSVAVTVNGEYEPHVGDFDGDGRDDVFWYGPYRGADYVWYGRANGGFQDTSQRVNGGYEVHVGDFDADDRDDIFWYGPGSGRGDYVWYGAGRGTFTSRGSGVSGYYRPQVADFTGDGRDDIFWYRPGRGQDYLWPATSSRGFGSVGRRVNGLYDPVVGDFDGNGRADILWNASSGTDYLWRRVAGQVSSVDVQVDASHRTVTVDADGNGDDEIFSLEDVASGRLWDGNGDTFSSTAVP